MTRILAVGNMYPPHHAGGYETMWQAAMGHARSLGHEVRVLVSDYRQAGVDGDQDPDVHRTLRWYWDLDRYEFPRLSLVRRFEIERHNARELTRHLTDFRPDVVAWWSMGCMSLSLMERARRAGVAGICVVHDDWLVYGPRYDQWIRMWRGKRLVVARLVELLFGVPTQVDLSAAGPCVFNSRYTLERALSAGLRAPRSGVIHPGIDERFLSCNGKCPWRWRLVYIGRIDRQKGIDTAVRALAHLPDSATLSVWGAGDSRYVDEMQRLADGLGIGDRIRFEGWADADELVSVYAEADAVVFPVRWEEPFGLVPLEAMGMGCPVVTTLRGGTAEFVRDAENALVFAADDELALARSIRRLAADERLRERLRECGKRTAAAFTVTQFADRTVEEIVRAAKPAPAAGACS